MQLGFLDQPPLRDPLPVNTAPWKQYPGVTLYLGDNLDIMRAMPSNSVQAGVTDPPYGIGFMGKEWDTFKPETVEGLARKMFQIGAGRMRNHDNPNVRGRSHSPALSPSQIEYDRSLDGQRGFQVFTETWAREIFRVLTPGAHLVVCGAPRSAHRMVCGIEDAGFEIRDSFAWLFGQGFPKSHNLEDGFGTALKPGHEPIALARKPFSGTVERCVEVWGTGALNIEVSRIATAGADDRDPRDGLSADTGRWPANVVLDEDAAELLDQQSGQRVSGANPRRRGSDKFRRIFGSFKGEQLCVPARGAERGGASRFYFVAKPSRLERDFGCDAMPMRSPGECTDREDGSAGLTPYAGAGRSGGGRNPHPTVKPVSLMRYLLALVVPPGGTVLDPFLGSGTTGMASVVAGLPFIGIERELDYLETSDARIAATLTEVNP
jgi:DNA modification methylase